MRSLLAWLADVMLGPRCPHCLYRARGPRTLDRHCYIDHAESWSGDERGLL